MVEVHNQLFGSMTVEVDVRGSDGINLGFEFGSPYVITRSGHDTPQGWDLDVQAEEEAWGFTWGNITNSQVTITRESPRPMDFYDALEYTRLGEPGRGRSYGVSNVSDLERRLIESYGGDPAEIYGEGHALRPRRPPHPYDDSHVVTTEDDDLDTESYLYYTDHNHDACKDEMRMTPEEGEEPFMLEDLFDRIDDVVEEHERITDGKGKEDSGEESEENHEEEGSEG